MLSIGIVSVPSKHDPAVSLSDIIENADRFKRHLGTTYREGLAENELLRDAVERCVERICEAAHRLGPMAPELMPDQPWGDVRGMGNRLRHAYDNIELHVLWNAVRFNVPALAEAARRALACLEPGSPATTA